MLKPTHTSSVRASLLFLPLTLLALLICVGATEAQTTRPGSGGLWNELTGAFAPAVEGERDESLIWRLDGAILEGTLAQTPLQATAGPVSSTTVITIPLPDGTLERFFIEESPIMDPALAASLPGVNTFRGRGVDDPNLITRFDRTPLGFHAIVLGHAGGAVFVQPVSLGETEQYVSYWGDSDFAPDFECLTSGFAGEIRSPELSPGAELVPSGSTLRTYRLAVAATGEYTQFYGSVANAQAQIVTTMNAVNAVYNVEIAVHLTLIGNNTDIVFTDPATDPFPLADRNAETQAVIDSVIGDANYDIGHLFHNAGSSISGNAGCIGCVCQSGTKGSGWSQGPNPSSGNFVFLVCHEMGHQHGANHTWNGPGCGTETSPARYEPGSGTTIMSYSSICGVDNIQGGTVGDLYFHAGSRAQIMTYLASTSCASTSSTGNGVPTVNAGANYTIPQGTPFRLTASANDPDGDPLTYCWEQYDIGNNANLNAVDEGTIPLFRSFPPTSQATRTFPRFSDLLAGNLFPGTLGEQLPSTNRTLTFRVTARDNVPGAGAADDDQMVITVSGSPFAVTYPDGGENVPAGAPTTVTWDVGGGSVATSVNILYSTDGGANFSTLASAVDNDGSHEVILPCTTTNNGRILIEAVGNVFFDISDSDFSVAPVAPSIAVNVDGGSVDDACEYLLLFDATVTDDGNVFAADVEVSVGLTTTNAVLGTPTVNKAQTNASTVSVSGSVLVSGLTGSPAIVQVTVTATDECGASNSDSSTGNVSDFTPPVIACPDSITVECSAIGGTPADDPQLVDFFLGATATDNCDDSPSIGYSAPTFFPHNQTTSVIFTATDASGNAASCTTTVTVEDTTPPEITVALNRDALWPPNHKMADIEASLTVEDICDPNPTFVLTSIESNEADNGLGDGDFPKDVQGASYDDPDTSFALRSERMGGGEGRKYTIIYTASDMDGNVAADTVCVLVPHDQSGKAAPASGFTADGTWIGEGQTSYDLVVFSDGDLDASRIDPHRAYVGNVAAALRPVAHSFFDANLDGSIDLVLTYSAQETRDLRKHSRRIDPIGLHYTVDDGNYLVSDIFAIGTPVLIVNVDSGDRSADDGLDDILDGTRVTSGGFETSAEESEGTDSRWMLRLDQGGLVTVEVFDIMGRRVRTVVGHEMGPGSYEFPWDGSSDSGRRVASGIYFYRVTAPGVDRVQKVVITR